MSLAFLVTKTKKRNSDLHDCFRPATKHLCRTTLSVTSLSFSISHTVVKEGLFLSGTRTHGLMSCLCTISKVRSHHDGGPSTWPCVVAGGTARLCGMESAHVPKRTARVFPRSTQRSRSRLSHTLRIAKAL